jgi:hypothetical protein
MREADGERPRRPAPDGKAGPPKPE